MEGIDPSKPHTTKETLRCVVHDLMLPNPLRWGDTTQLSADEQAKLEEEVGEITPVKSGWRGTHFTWLPNEYVSIALMQVDHGCTLVYVPTLQEIFFASDVTMLPKDTPSGTVLVGLYTEDQKPHFRVPRILVHDVLAWGQTFEGSRTPLEQRAAASRYKLLREQFQPLLVNERYLVLQWCGFLSAAKKFLSGEVTVGHPVGGLVAILDGAAGAPCALSRETVEQMQ